MLIFYTCLFAKCVFLLLNIHYNGPIFIAKNHEDCFELMDDFFDMCSIRIFANYEPTVVVHDNYSQVFLEVVSPIKVLFKGHNDVQAQPTKDFLEVLI